MAHGEAGHGLLGTWTQGKAQARNKTQGSGVEWGTCITLTPFHRHDCSGDGLGGDLKCSMTQIHLFISGAPAEAGAELITMKCS